MPLLATFLGSVPIGMPGLGLLLLVQQTTGSYAAAGAAAGALNLGNAVGLVVQGRLIDRHGPTPVLLCAAALCPALLVALTAAVAHHVAAPLVAALAAAAGAALPATVTGMRVLWPRLVADPPTRAAAYALLGTLFQIAMVAGPLSVSALLLTGSATSVLPAAAALAAAGGLLFATAPAVRGRPSAAVSPGNSANPDGATRAPRDTAGPNVTTRPHDHSSSPTHTTRRHDSSLSPTGTAAPHDSSLSPTGTAPPHDSSLSPTDTIPPHDSSPGPSDTTPPHGRSAGPGLTTLVLGSFGGGIAIGMLTVAVAAARPALAGLLFAAFSAGELLGGLAYGGRDWNLPARSRLLLGQCGMAGCAAALAAAAGSAGLMLPVMVLIGALAAPVSIANSALLDDVVPSGSLGRAYTTLVSAGLLGVAAGNAAAGSLGGDARTTLLLTAAALAAVFLWTLSRRRTLTVLSA